MATDHSPVNNNSTVNTNGDSPSSPATLTLRMIMSGKEVGSIIGKKGDNVKKFREESGAKINISDASCPERIVTVTGTTDAIFKAFTMICKKFEEDLQNIPNHAIHPVPGQQHSPQSPQVPVQPPSQHSPTLPTQKLQVTIRLIVPASQCGSLIGKGGSKIKEIREVTGATIQVASDMLPNSTERAVTVSGTADAITQCIYHICCVMIESPPKGATIPYRPKPVVPPVIYAGGQAYAIHGQYVLPHDNYARPGMVHYSHAMPQPQNGAVAVSPNSNNPWEAAFSSYKLTKMAMQQGMVPQQSLPFLQQGTVLQQPGVHPHAHPAGLTQQTLQAAYTARPTPPAAGANNTQTHEMTIPNDLIGCIIGRGGAKINEIRQLSGAMIKIANSEEGSTDRKVTITGTPETIHTAQFLINSSIELHKSTMALVESSSSLSPTSTVPTLTSAATMPMKTLVHHPGTLQVMATGGMPIFDHSQAALNHKLTTKMKGVPVLPMAAKTLKVAGERATSIKFAPY